MKQKPYLLFDAGGTLVFPDFKFMADIASQMDIETNPDELFTIHCKLIKELDTRTYTQMKLIDPFPNGYAKTLFAGILTNEEQKSILSNQITIRDRHKSLWTATYPWVEKTISTMKTEGYSMSVISNSDGRVAKILYDLNLAPYFDMIFDSEIIGFSKPDIRLFEFALNQLSLNSEEAIYIGDVFFIDIWGANQAGLGSIHLDPLNLYENWLGIHIPTIRNLENLLHIYREMPDHFDLYPGLNFEVKY